MVNMKMSITWLLRTHLLLMMPYTKHLLNYKSQSEVVLYVNVSSYKFEQIENVLMGSTDTYFTMS